MRSLLLTLGFVTLLAAPAMAEDSAPAKAESKKESKKEKAEAPTSKNPKVRFKTSMGTIDVELDEEKAPITVKNFLSYVKKKHYDGTIFHRVIPGFMIQGGGFDAKMTEKGTQPPIKNEAGNGLKNDEGTIAMARLPDPDSASAQFFINVVNNDMLNHKSDAPQEFGYAVFGKVIAGMDVVHKIEKVETGSQGMFQDVPKKPVKINSVKTL